MPRAKKGRLNIRISPDLLEEAQTFAKKDHRTLTNLVESLLVAHINAAKAKEKAVVDAESI